MSGRSFRSVFMVASCAGAALGCYLVSLRVASERAAVESVETRIVLAQRDIRLLQTEIGTRGRLAQLERWNVKVLALSAPSADQFLDGGFALAKMVAPRDKVDLDAPVVLAAAPADGPRPQIVGRQQQPQEQQPEHQQDSEEGVSASQMLHVAGLKREARPEPKAAFGPATAPKPASGKAADKPVTAAKVPLTKAKPVTAERKPAASDPLAPLGNAAKPRKLASAEPKDSGRKQ